MPEFEITRDLVKAKYNFPQVPEGFNEYCFVDIRHSDGDSFIFDTIEVSHVERKSGLVMVSYSIEDDYIRRAYFHIDPITRRIATFRYEKCDYELAFWDFSKKVDRVEIRWRQADALWRKRNRLACQVQFGLLTTDSTKNFDLLSLNPIFEVRNYGFLEGSLWRERERAIRIGGNMLDYIMQETNSKELIKFLPSAPSAFEKAAPEKVEATIMEF